MSQQISGPGKAMKAPAERFTGDVYLSMLKMPTEPSRLLVAQVRFTPGARTNWHSHALGDVEGLTEGTGLVGTEGTGLVGTRDGVVHQIHAGQTVWCPADEDHWHGAGPETYMSHLALVEGDGGADGTTWREPVEDGDYTATPTPAA